MENEISEIFKGCSIEEEDPELYAIHPLPKFHSTPPLQNIQKPIPLKFKNIDHGFFEIHPKGSVDTKMIYLNFNFFKTPKRKFGLFEGNIPKIKRSTDIQKEFPPLKKSLFV
ncbi:MAG: hypothetical protein CMF41_05540 [Legionellales bacterium]|nr:hypothetical protein [Legionellales bacterium]OUX64516.1 MAG: hypothetical protein CBE41_03155 [Gammaproteobacteria bacterium TMED281]|tara:strand:- start:548 stop:883 length:336 start_codon:yes stop_codon:yes gene_type:complete